MKKFGIWLIILINLGTLSLWILSKENLGLVLVRPYRSIAQIAGLLAATLSAIQFLLAARWKVVEKFFGGLDKVYRAHAYAGGLALIFMLNHPVALALNVLPSAPAALNYFWLSNNLSYNFGVLALYFMLLLLVLTLFVRLPYHIWKKTHTFLFVPQILILLHIIFINSDTSQYLALRIWMLSLSALGLLAYAYKKFLYPNLGYRHAYEIAGVKQLGSIIEINMLPLARKISFLPGQFVFLSFKSDKLSKEEHPFTISSWPQQKELRVSVKALGDFTKRLAELKPKDKVSVYGPFGQLGEKSLFSEKDDVWIAGGIGITPFLSLLAYYSNKKLKKKIWLFYTVRNVEDAVYAQEMRNMSRINPNIEIITAITSQGERLSGNAVVEKIETVKNKNFFLCGPLSLINDLTEQLYELGVRPGQIILEEFNFLP